MVDRVGQQLGNYRLVRLLGQGGFAEVYLGEHVYLDTQAAIKVLQTQLAREDIEQFHLEARIIARLEHPHIVRVLDFGVEGSTPFLVMSYAPNGTLRIRHPKGTRVPLSTVVSYVQQVAPALQYAHEQRLIHRDIKPENLLVGRAHEVLLSDFGIALVAQSSRYQSTRDMAGTIAYMAPEQIEAHPRPASDQYSLGIVVYEWLSGDRPFHGSFTEIAIKHSVVPPPSLREKLPTLSPAVEQVVLTALAKDPRQRFASVQAFATALEQAGQVGADAETLPASLTLPATGEQTLRSSTQLPTEIATQPSESVIPTELVTPPSQPSQPTNVVTPPSKSGQAVDALSPPILASTSSTPAPVAPASEPNLPPITTPPRPPFPPVNLQTPATQPSRVNGRTILLVGLALLVIVGGIGLFAIIHANQVATLNAIATATAAAADATGAAQATASVIAANPDPYGGGTLAFYDPLSDNSSGNWTEDTHCRFTGGAFHVSTAQINNFWTCSESTDFNNFVYQVQMKIIKGDNGGVAFRGNTTNSTYYGYIFSVGNDGSYQLFVCPLNSTGCNSSLLTGSSGAINHGLNQTNVVAVRVTGNTITLYVNHQKIASTTDSTFSQGSIGVIADEYSNPTEVAYSNVKVWKL